MTTKIVFKFKAFQLSILLRTVAFCQLFPFAVRCSPFALNHLLTPSPPTSSPPHFLPIIDTPLNRDTLPALIIHYSSFIIHYFLHLLTPSFSHNNRYSFKSSYTARSHYSLFIIHYPLPSNLIVKIRKKNIKKTYLSDNLNIFALTKVQKVFVIFVIVFIL